MTLVRLLPLSTEPALVFPSEGHLEFKNFKFDLSSLENRRDKFEFKKHKERKKVVLICEAKMNRISGLIT